MVDLHHLIADGVSTHLLLQELAQLYQQKTLPAVTLQYKDYAHWQQQFMKTPPYKEREPIGNNSFLGNCRCWNYQLIFHVLLSSNLTVIY